MTLELLKFSDEDSVRVPAAAMHRQVSVILQSVGTPATDAETVADILTRASLMGVDSHGVGNTVRYAEFIETGVYTVPQRVEVVSESDTTALLSCGNGLGFVAAHRAMQLSIEKARRHGVGMASVRDSHHIGMVGYYPLMAVDQDMIGMAVTNASPSMRPALGARAKLGTNPIAFGAPAGEERPFLLDMATTTVAMGKVLLANRLGLRIPEGWAVDAEGRPLTDPPPVRGDHWSVNPLGNTLEQGAHKGYGLAVVVDILAGVLSGGGFGSQLAHGENMTWTMAIDIGRFRPVDEFKAMMDALIRDLHATPPEAGAERVLVAGDPQWAVEEDRVANGILLHATRVDELRAFARRRGAEVLI